VCVREMAGQHPIEVFSSPAEDLDPDVLGCRPSGGPNAATALRRRPRPDNPGPVPMHHPVNYRDVRQTDGDREVA